MSSSVPRSQFNTDIAMAMLLLHNVIILKRRNIPLWIIPPPLDPLHSNLDNHKNENFLHLVKHNKPYALDRRYKQI